MRLVPQPVSTIHQREQLNLTRARLGRIATAADTGAASGRPVGSITFLDPTPPPTPVRFPLGCRTRRVDASGRIKLQLGDTGLSQLLGWTDGVLDFVTVNGWAVLTQRPEQRHASRGRNSSYAGFSVAAGGVERIGLSPTHLHLIGVATGDEVLMAALPEHNAITMCNPDIVASLAPAHVARLLEQSTPSQPIPNGTVVDHVVTPIRTISQGA